MCGVGGLVDWLGAAHDHELAAPTHATGPAWRGPGFAVDDHQCLQRGHAPVVRQRQCPDGGGRFVLGVCPVRRAGFWFGLGNPGAIPCLGAIAPARSELIKILDLELFNLQFYFVQTWLGLIRLG